MAGLELLCQTTTRSPPQPAAAWEAWSAFTRVPRIRSVENSPRTSSWTSRQLPASDFGKDRLRHLHRLIALQVILRVHDHFRAGRRILKDCIYRRPTAFGIQGRDERFAFEIRKVQLLLQEIRNAEIIQVENAQGLFVIIDLIPQREVLLLPHLLDERGFPFHDCLLPGNNIGILPAVPIIRCKIVPLELQTVHIFVREGGSFACSEFRRRRRRTSCFFSGS